MARTPRDDVAAAELGAHLTTLLPAGTSFDDIAKAMYLDGYDVSAETIRKAHRGLVDPHSCPVELLLALRRHYAVDPEELGPVATKRMANLLVLTSPPPSPAAPTRKRSAAPRSASKPDARRDNVQSGWFSRTAARPAA